MNAEYNPRKIGDDERRKLKSNLERVGLLSPLVWNSRTGNLVSGHQRLSILDQLNGTKNYTLKVAKVDLDEKTEKEQNVFFNNAQAMGDWDFDKLEQLFVGENKVDYENTGFDLSHIYAAFGDNLEVQMQLPTAAKERSKQLANLMKLAEEDRKTDPNNPNFYLVIVFRDYEHRKAFTETVGWDDVSHHDGRKLITLLENKEDAE